jgi:hypothetical protein
LGEVEEIGDGELLTRACFDDPGLVMPPEAAFYFQYDKDRDERAESVYWRKYAPEVADIHTRGCTLQSQWASKGGPMRYSGSRDAHTGSIRKIVTERGHTFDVVHYPQGGDLAHAHIAVVRAGGNVKKLSSNDRLDLIHHLVKVLGELAPHQCGT